MYILGISGSPRKGGNTDILLTKALLGAESVGAKTEKVILNDLNMAPCQECARVRDDGTCKIEDDFPPLHEKIKKADALILATPIFFGSLSAQTKIMIDRFQCQWRYKYELKKEKSGGKRPAAFIAVEASDREDFFKNAKAIAKNMFAVAGLLYKDELFCPGLSSKGAVLEKKEFLKKAFELGRNLISGKRGK